MRTLIAVLVMAVLVGSVGCTDKAKMCEAIGKTTAVSLQPRDRIYWEENCNSESDKEKVVMEYRHSEAQRVALEVEKYKTEWEWMHRRPYVTRNDVYGVDGSVSTPAKFLSQKREEEAIIKRASLK
jgi:hypothetical protein